MENYLIGVDVGTTGTKSILLSEKGETVAHAYEGYKTFAPDTLTCEQDAEVLWGAVVRTVRRVCETVADKEKVAGISLSTQGGTLIPTDENYRPVCNAVVWSDKSCDPERERFLTESGLNEEMLYEKTGWNLSHGLPLLQIRRLRDRKPQIFEKANFFLSVPDYVSARMTGIPATDMSNAGINELTDIRKGEYDPELCAFAGVRDSQLARLVNSCTPVGRLTDEAAGLLGLTTDTVLVAGAHDQYAVALGAGLINDGDMLIGSGTSWVVTAIRNEPDFSSGLSQSVSAIPGKWGSLLSLSYGGACLEWLRNNLICPSDGEPVELREIDRGCENARAARDGLFFYPFSAKLTDRSPESNTRAVFTGLDVSHDRYDVALAIMEGVAFQIKWMCESFGCISENGIRLTGGASKSPLWTRIIADVVGKPVIVSASPDMACVGAAIMAGVGTSVFRDACDGVRRTESPERTVSPDPDRMLMYSEKFETYRKNAALIAQF